MTLNEYIKRILESKISNNKSRAKILIELFDAAKSKKEVSASSAYKWMGAIRNPGISTYFPEGKKDFDEDDVYKYFRNRTDAQVEDLRKAFRGCDGGIVKYEDDPDVFCRSLVDQFLAILGFSMSQAPDGEKPKNETISEQMYITFKQVFQDCNITEFLSNDLSEGINPGLLSWVDRFLETIESDILNLPIFQKEEIMLTNISRYTNEMRRYRNFIKEKMRPRTWGHNDGTLVFRYGNVFEKDEFGKTVKYYRKRLLSIYHEIFFFRTNQS